MRQNRGGSPGRRVANALNHLLSKGGLKLVRARDGRELDLSDAPDGGEVGRRVTQRDIEDGLRGAQYRFPDRKPVVLTDPAQSPDLADLLERLRARGIETLECRRDSDPSAVLGDIAGRIFVYGCDDDAIGLPYVAEIVRSNGVYFPVPGYVPATYAHVNAVARDVCRDEYIRQSGEGFDKFDLGPGDFLNIIQMIEATRDLPGDFVEIGCFRGSSGCAALAYMRAASIGRNCHFLDVFTGFDYAEAEESADQFWAGSHATEGPEIVGRRLSHFEGGDPEVTVSVHTNNVISDDLPEAIGKIAVANIDVDIYEAVLAALRRVAPRIVPGGVIIAEDAGHTPSCIGARLAQQEFEKDPISKAFLPVYMATGQTLYVRTGADAA